jgi:hypothetical protein
MADITVVRFTVKCVHTTAMLLPPATITTFRAARFSRSLDVADHVTIPHSTVSDPSRRVPIVWLSSVPVCHHVISVGRFADPKLPTTQ